MEFVNGKSKQNDVGLFIMVFTLSISYLIVFNRLVTQTNNSILYLFSALILFMTPILGGWVLVFGQHYFSEQTIKIIESITTLGSSFSIGVFLLSRTIHGGCDDAFFLDSWHCNPNFSSNSLPQDTGICY